MIIPKALNMDNHKFSSKERFIRGVATEYNIHYNIIR